MRKAMIFIILVCALTVHIITGVAMVGANNITNAITTLQTQQELNNYLEEE